MSKSTKNFGKRKYYQFYQTTDIKIFSYFRADFVSEEHNQIREKYYFCKRFEENSSLNLN
jgi:hypothetical protein